MPTATVNGIRLYYEAHGQGPPLLLIGGLGHGGWVWARQVPAFAERWRVIAFDNRGAGRSDKPSEWGATHRGQSRCIPLQQEPYTIPLFASDALGLLDALGLERACVLGHSLGGMIALQLALDHPERVERLALCATTHGGPGVVLPAPEVLQFLTQRGGTPAERFQQGLELAFGLAFLRTRLAEAEFIREALLKNPQPDDAYRRQALSALGFDVEARLGELNLPVLVLSGDSDRVVPVENARRLAQKIPGATLTLLPGAGHLCFVEQPQAFNRAVVDFLGGVA